MNLKKKINDVLCYSILKLLQCLSPIILTANVERLAEVAELELQLFGLPSFVDYYFTVEFSTSAAILANLCYAYVHHLL